MTYYTDTPQLFWIDDVVVKLTEEQAEDYQSEHPECEMQTATDVDLERQELNGETVCWLDGEPVTVSSDEWADFQKIHVDDDVSLEYASRDAVDDVIDCKCTDSTTCDDCYDWLQSLLVD
jgi:hypothetical protein